MLVGMNKLLSLTTLALITAGSASAQSVVYRQPLELGLTGGYAGGLSGEAFVHAPNVAGPVGIKAGVAVSKASLNEGAQFGGATYGDIKRTAAASGTPVTDGGTNTVVSLDGTYSLGELAPGVDATVYAGPRYGMFNRYVTFGSSTTNFSSSAFGLGAGVMASYALTPSTSIVGDLGADHFFNSGITASQGGVNDTLNPGDTGYDEMRSLTNVPGTQFKARIGVKFGF